jgi:hypothetical protein
MATVILQINETADSDSDGMPDGWEIEHNLDPLDPSDAVLDSDLDDLTNLQEFLNITNPTSWDTDHDEIPDGWEIEKGFDPNSGADGGLDPDNDGLNNKGEYANGGDPNDSDTDDDDLPDGWEVTFGLNATDDSDVNNDPDMDGLTNIQEYMNNSLPNNNDTDGDNLGDGFEVIFSKTKPDKWDTNGNGVGDGLEFILNKGYLGWIESLPHDWIGMTITWDNYTIMVRTNSTLLEGEFDKEERKLKIKVSGPTDGLGITEIDITKNLCDPEDIEIMLDGELINYTITEDDTCVQELSANFREETDIIDKPIDDEEVSPEIPYLLAFIIAVIVAILLLIMVIKGRNGYPDGRIRELPPEKLMMLLENKYEEGKITDKTYEDIKSLLDKYNGK